MFLFSSAAATLVLAAVPTLGAPSNAQLKPIQTYAGETIPQSYIVKLHEGVSKTSHLAWLASTAGPTSNITHGEWDPSVLNGFAGTFGSDALDALRASPDVDYVAEDGIVHTAALVTQTGAPWGLQRISQTARLDNQNDTQLTFTYTYNDTAAGAGVDIYVLDTGIFTNHSEFAVGRATWGATFGPYANADGEGHGTHAAGIAAGKTYGVAKNASLIAVKVLSDSGGGAISDVISGMNWVAQQANITGRPTIATMSLSGPGNTSLDDAVASLTSLGIHVTVAAGNNNGDASLNSPGRAPSAITVGASTISDTIAMFTNYGAVIDMFAPGQDVISAWIGGVNNTNILSGTSMATPHVAGLIATIISLEGNMSPADMSNRLQALSTKDVLTLPNGTINDLAHVDV